MIVVGVILLLIGSLVPMDGRAKNACVILGIILAAVGVLLWVMNGSYWRYY